MSIASDLPFEPAPFPVRLFTVEEYHQLGELGILTNRDAVELLAGYIVPKMIHNPPHDAAVELADFVLRPMLTEGWRIRIQSAITTDDSEPEPDLVIVSGAIRDHLSRHPRPDEIGLLVEVADSSVQRDRLKSELYASAGISTYWIVNLPESQLEVYSSPIKSDSRYENHNIFRGEQGIDVVIDGSIFGSVQATEFLP